MEPQRTIPQNRSLHLWCKHIADELNSAGYTQKMVLTKPLDVDFTEHTVKDLMRHLGKKLYGKGHTRDFTTKEFQTVMEHIIRGLGEKGISLPPFPSNETRDEQM